MAKIHEIFPSNFLSGEDILNHAPVLVVIERVYREEVYDPKSKEKDAKKRKKRVLVLAFKGARKPMICNKTNAKRIAKLHGKETNDWVGKSITLHTERVFAFDDWHNALRVQMPETGSKQLKGQD